MTGNDRLVLGTVNFGMDYGYLGGKSRIKEENAFEIIDHSILEKIQFFDTAQDYGRSEEILGKYVLSNGQSQLNIITKFLAGRCTENPVNRSLRKLNLHRIYAILFHDFDDYLRHPKTFQQLQQNQKKGEVEKIGFSLYSPQHLEYLLSRNIPFQIVQVPYSIFDQRFDQYFSELKARNVEIHVRSIFLNGLFFQDPKALGDHFGDVKDNLEELTNISRKLEVPISSLCLNFVGQHQYVDKLVIGVRTVSELLKNIRGISSSPNLSSHKKAFDAFSCDDQSILYPHKWRI